MRSTLRISRTEIDGPFFSSVFGVTWRNSPGTRRDRLEKGNRIRVKFDILIKTRPSDEKRTSRRCSRRRTFMQRLGPHVSKTCRPCAIGVAIRRIRKHTVERRGYERGTDRLTGQVNPSGRVVARRDNLVYCVLSNGNRIVKKKKGILPYFYRLRYVLF